jgi:hypothetical protein
VVTSLTAKDAKDAKMSKDAELSSDFAVLPVANVDPRNLVAMGKHKCFP